LAELDLSSKSKLTYIGYAAFEQSDVTSVKLPNSVTFIGDSAFYDCENLETIAVPFIGNTVASLTENSYTNAQTIFNGIFGMTTRSTTSNKLITAAAESDVEEDEDVVIANRQISLTVNEMGTIGESMFADFTDLKSFTLNKFSTSGYHIVNGSDGVSVADRVYVEPQTTVAKNAFYGCTYLQTVSLPDDVTEIDDYAFAGCGRLQAFTLPTNVESIGYMSFGFCKNLTKVTFGKNLTDIGTGAFVGCIRLEAIDIPANVEKIDVGAFYGCNRVSNITIAQYDWFEGGSYYTSLGEVSNWFGYEDDYEAMTFDEFMKYMRNPSTYATTSSDETTSSNTTSYFAPTDVTITVNSIYRVNNNMFSGLDSVKTIELNFTAIPTKKDYNYYGASTDKKIIDDYIGDYAFSGCSSLTSITLTNSTATKIGDHTFYGCSKLTSVAIPETVETIGDYAFAGCETFTSVTLPETVTVIGVAAFKNCNSLTSITLPEALTTIKTKAFELCTSLTSITIPAKVTEVGSAILKDCKSLRSITVESYTVKTETVNTQEIPSIKSQEDYKELMAKIEEDSKTMTDDELMEKYADAMQDLIEIKTITTTTSSASSLGKLNSWFGTSVDLVDGYGNSVYTNSQASSYDGLYYTSDSSMYYTGNYYIPVSLKSITLNNVTELADSALVGFQKVETINVDFVETTTTTQGKMAVTIGDNAFYGLKNTTLNLTNADLVYSIGTSAFENAGIEDGFIEEFSGVREIETRAFANNSALTKVTLPDTLLAVGEKIFFNCESIATLDVGRYDYVYGVQIIAKLFGATNAYGKSNYDSDTDTVKYVYVSTGSGDYYVPKSLTTVTLSNIESFASLDSYAFRNLSMVKQIALYFAEDLEKEEVSTNYFYGCSALLKVYVPETFEKLYLNGTTWNFEVGYENGDVDTYIYLYSAPTSYGNTGHWYHYDEDSEIEAYEFVENDYYFNYNYPVVETPAAADEQAPAADETEKEEEAKYEKVTKNVVQASDAPDVAANAPDGYIFVGWYTSADFSGYPISFPYYNPTGSTVPEGSAEDATRAGVQLYARWVKTESTVVKTNGLTKTTGTGDEATTTKVGEFTEYGNTISAAYSNTDTVSNFYYAIRVWETKEINITVTTPGNNTGYGYFCFSVNSMISSSSTNYLTKYYNNNDTYSTTLRAGDSLYIYAWISSSADGDNMKATITISNPAAKETPVMPENPDITPSPIVTPDFSVEEKGVEMENVETREELAALWAKYLLEIDWNSWNMDYYANEQHYSYDYDRTQEGHYYIEASSDTLDAIGFDEIILDFSTSENKVVGMIVSVGGSRYYIEGDDFGVSSAIRESLQTEEDLKEENKNNPIMENEAFHYYYDEETKTYYLLFNSSSSSGVETIVYGMTFVKDDNATSSTDEEDELTGYKVYFTVMVYSNGRLTQEYIYSNLNKKESELTEEQLSYKGSKYDSFMDFLMSYYSNLGGFDEAEDSENEETEQTPTNP
jgi:hypothetical protein